MDVVICMSAINYFTRKRGGFLIAEVYRILALGGITRFGTQDLERIAKRYVDRDREFFYQKLNGRERFHGSNYGDSSIPGFTDTRLTGGIRVSIFMTTKPFPCCFVRPGLKTTENRPFQDSSDPRGRDH